MILISHLRHNHVLIMRTNCSLLLQRCSVLTAAATSHYFHPGTRWVHASGRPGATTGGLCTCAGGPSTHFTHKGPLGFEAGRPRRPTTGSTRLRAARRCVRKAAEQPEVRVLVPNEGLASRLQGVISAEAEIWVRTRRRLKFNCSLLLRVTLTTFYSSDF